MKTPTLRRPSAGEIIAVLAALAPWTWFLVRNLDARLDAIALLWPVIGGAGAWAALALTIILRSRVGLLVTISWTVCLVAVVLGPWRPLGTGDVAAAGGVRIVSANVYGNHTYPPGNAQRLREQHPDVLVVVEINKASLPSYAEGWSHVVAHPGDESASDVGVFTDLPMRDLGLPDGLRDQRGQRVQIDGPDGPFVLYAMHLQKPGISPSSVELGFRSHRRLVDALADAVRAETLPVVVAGDLNLGDRTSGYRALTDVLDDGMRAGWTGPTSLRKTTRLLLARIDHIFEPPSWCAERSLTFTMRGSDHRGVATTIGPCA